MKIFDLSAEDFIPKNQLFLVAFRHQTHEVPHRHEFYELVFVLSGTAVHLYEDVPEPISSGRVILVSPGRKHMYKSPDGLMLCNVLMKKEALEWFAGYENDLPLFRLLFLSGEYHPLVLSPARLAAVNVLLEKIMAEQTGCSAGSLFAGKIFFMEVILELCRSGGSGPGIRPDKSLRLGQMLRFINLHHTEDITRDDIFRAGFCSTRSGNRLFAEQLHSTPMRELLKVRIDHARELLPFFSASETAIRCGFRDSNYFSLCFKKATGLSPRAYMKRVAEEIDEKSRP